VGWRGPFIKGAV